MYFDTQTLQENPKDPRSKRDKWYSTGSWGRKSVQLCFIRCAVSFSTQDNRDHTNKITSSAITTQIHTHTHPLSLSEVKPNNVTTCGFTTAGICVPVDFSIALSFWSTAVKKAIYWCIIEDIITVWKAGDSCGRLQQIPATQVWISYYFYYHYYCCCCYC